MSNGKRRYFPGANTGRGFIGHFEGIVPPWSEPVGIQYGPFEPEGRS